MIKCHIVCFVDNYILKKCDYRLETDVIDKLYPYVLKKNTYGNYCSILVCKVTGP